MNISYEMDNMAVEEHAVNGERWAIVRCANRRYMVARWNAHHNNWVRENRQHGGAVHRSLAVVATDNIGGGPVYMTLSAAREMMATA